MPRKPPHKIYINEHTRSFILCHAHYIKHKTPVSRILLLYYKTRRFFNTHIITTCAIILPVDGTTKILKKNCLSKAAWVYICISIRHCPLNFVHMIRVCYVRRNNQLIMAALPLLQLFSRMFVTIHTNICLNYANNTV